MSECFANAAVEASANGSACLLSDTDLAHRYYKNQSKDVYLFKELSDLIYLIKNFQEDNFYYSSKFSKKYIKEKVISSYYNALFNNKKMI